MTIIFANSPFDKECRFDCKKVQMNTTKFGELCILPNYRNSIFDINNSVVSVFDNENKEIKVKITNSAIVKIQDNTINIFGQFSEL